MRNPAHPRQVGYWQPSVDAPRPDLVEFPITNMYPPIVRGDRVFLVGLPALTEIDVSHPDAPVLVRTYGDDYADPFSDELPSLLRPYVGGAALDGDRAWLALGTYGVELVDLVDPVAIRRVARYDTLGEARDVLVAGDRVWVADAPGGLLALDRTTGAPVGALESITADRLAMGGTTAFAFRYATTEEGVTDPSVFAVDTGDATYPMVRGRYAINYPYYPWGMLTPLVAISDVMYLGEGGAGLGILRLVEGDALPTPTRTAVATPTRTPRRGTGTTTPTLSPTPSPPGDRTDTPRPPLTAPPPTSTGTSATPTLSSTVVTPTSRGTAATPTPTSDSATNEPRVTTTAQRTGTVAPSPSGPVTVIWLPIARHGE